MGNALGGRKAAKIMKIDGETIKLKTPVQAGEIVTNHPGHVLLESESVKHYGLRAKPMELHHELKPGRLYFLVQLPKFDASEDRGPRRVRSGVMTLNAKERLESLMLARRSASDLSILRAARIATAGEEEEDRGGPVRVTLRLQRADVERAVAGSKDGEEAAEKIVKLCLGDSGGSGGGGGGGTKHKVMGQMGWGQSANGRVREGFKARQKRVSFVPAAGGNIQVDVA